LAESPRTALLLHGAGGGGWEWCRWQRVFEEAGWRVRAPDLVPAVAGLECTRLDDYRAQVEASGAGCDALIGASLGGLLALLAAPHLAPRALVLVNPLPPAPWHAGLPERTWPDVVPWGREACLETTMRALPDADEATCRMAAARWRDESGAVLREARAGVAAEPPGCPLLVVVSGRDEDVPMPAGRALARAWSADVLALPAASHVGPLLGRDAERVAAQVLAWLAQKV
jgi:pimeloyl-ACP methyl ester carboxylesterase